jgi:hypothetical protein
MVEAVEAGDLLTQIIEGKWKEVEEEVGEVA